MTYEDAISYEYADAGRVDHPVGLAALQAAID